MTATSYFLSGGVGAVAGANWAPANVDIALDFANDRYWQRVGGYVGSPLVLSRATSAWRTATDGKAISEFSANMARRDARGLYLEGYDRARLSRFSITPPDWVASSAPAVDRVTQAQDGSFVPQLVSRPTGGAAFSALQDAATGFAIVSGENLSLRSLFKSGTSGRYRAVIRRIADGNAVSTLNGPIGALASTVNTLGTWTDIFQFDRSTDAKELLASIIPASSQSDIKLEIGPDAAADGGNVTMCGAQMTRERFPGEWVLGAPSTGFTQDDDKASLPASEIKTLSADFDFIGYPSGAANAVVWHYGNATTYTRLVYEVSSGKLFAQAYVGGVQRCSLDLGTITVGSSHVVSFAWADNAFSSSIDGAASVTGGSGTAPTGMTTLYLAQDSAGASGAIAVVRSVFMFKTVIAP